MVRVIVNGASGKMGEESVGAVKNKAGLDLVAALDMGDNLSQAIQEMQADVVVDFTHPSCVFENAQLILNAGARPVVGTTGLTESELSAINELAIKKEMGAMVCPNFAIGAILMMKFAAEAVKYMPNVEIIEMHHDQKADAPSGTAIKTAELIYESNANVNPGLAQLKETESIKGARGGDKSRVPIHSIRLPGYVAHQEVICGGVGQTLTLRHDTINRESFMPGVVLACEKVMGIKGLVYGLEHVL